MRYVGIVTAVAAALLAVSGAVPALGGAVEHELTVAAGDTAYAEAPVWVPVKAPSAVKSARLREVDGPPVPCQLVRSGANAWVVFVLRDLGPATTRHYTLTLSDESPAQRSRGVAVEPEGDAVTVTVDGDLFTSYRFADAPKPYCYPVIGPGGLPLTRNYPMKDVPGEAQDHAHHRSFWFTFGEVNGHDFWTEGEGRGRIVHREFELLESGPVVGIIRARNDWVAADGAKVCEDVRELRVYRTRNGRLLDFAVTIIPVGEPVHFGDTKEGMFAFRVASSMEVPRGAGRIVNSEGQVNGEAWGKRAAWCDYSGPVDGRTVGIAILDHPDNFRHPTYWHVREYGLFAANPFGLRYYLGPEKADEGLRVMPGTTLTFRYRVWLHDGAAPEADVAAVYAEYAHPLQVTVR
ncbi:MAG: PmoA family protein [Armatimonadota bacterium]|nr:MAG: PmoA family protein [Armatimonadota bacterium]